MPVEAALVVLTSGTWTENGSMRSPVMWRSFSSLAAEKAKTSNPQLLRARYAATAPTFCAERPGLIQRPVTQLGRANAQREPEIAANQRTRAGLPAAGLAVDDSMRKPSDAPYTAADNPAGPAPTTALGRP